MHREHVQSQLSTMLRVLGITFTYRCKQIIIMLTQKSCIEVNCEFPTEKNTKNCARSRCGLSVNDDDDIVC